MTTAYKRDAFLRNKSCPWIMNMKLQKGETVHFQIEVNERGQPTVSRIIRPPLNAQTDVEAS